MIEINRECILQASAKLKARKGMIDFDTLGRTLSYSPYMPRIKREFFIRTELRNMPKVIHTYSIANSSQHTPLLYACAKENPNKEPHAYMLDLSAQYAQNQDEECMSHLEPISLLRRHSTLPIIHADIFLDVYQVLESALFGADMLFMPIAPLDGKDFKQLLDFARRLELDVFVFIRDKDELKRAIFNGADMLFILQENFSELLSLVPNTQVIATNASDEYGVDVWVRDESDKVNKVKLNLKNL
ncbi:beta/alpha barrel domain-containing protein [Helicobacter marmotae]|uniref:indole-3-glycerol-phosphate synthase n=1 Tax=Helicobacter marmotae TaxID=152490 RepID=A0A3D8I4C6_9HELI|nr:indole-3-glycerol phosphate synthase [Helicobacter marmotae]RDU59604.1 indole-3-glycerol phosphate synthase [Helicobacter marmotae]